MAPESDAPSRGELTRRRLLDAARDLIAEGGWSAVSSRAIAGRAEANLAAVNYHFGGQRELLRAVIDRSTERLVSEYGPHHLFDRPAAFVRAAAETIPTMRDDPDVRVVYSAILESPRDPELRRMLVDKLANIRGLFRELLKDRGLTEDQQEGWTILLAAIADGLLLHVMLDESTDVGVAARMIETTMRELIEEKGAS